MAGKTKRTPLDSARTSNAVRSKLREEGMIRGVNAAPGNENLSDTQVRKLYEDMIIRQRKKTPHPKRGPKP